MSDVRQTTVGEFDPLDAALWHAEEKVVLFTAHVKAALEQVHTLTHIRAQWKQHADALRRVRQARPCEPDDYDTRVI